MTHIATLDTVLDALKANRAQIVERMIETAATAPEHTSQWAALLSDTQGAIEAVEAHVVEIGDAHTPP